MYERLYRAQLSMLDAAGVWARLHTLAGAAEPVLLCYERPEDIAAGRTFCHRHMAAAWFAETLGSRVDEI